MSGSGRPYILLCYDCGKRYKSMAPVMYCYKCLDKRAIKAFKARNADSQAQRRP